MADNKSFYLKIWLAVFFYTLLAGLIIQLIILPVVFPAWHAGDGLLKGGDWLYFNSVALDLAAEIELYGWSAWQLRPEEQASAGIAAAIYALTGVTKPWVILPLNAAVHATSAFILLFIVGSVTGRSRPSVWPVLPFIFFPTALLWNAQFHKDSLFILGSFLFLYGLLQLAGTANRTHFLRSFADFALLMIGILLIWIVRPYGVEMVLYIGIVLAVIASVFLLINLKNDRKLAFKIAFIWLALFLALPLTSTGVHHQYVEVDYLELPVNPGPEAWHRSTLLPGFIDETIYKMAILRERYLVHKPEAGSNIDLHVRFSSAGEAIRYIPRALQIGLLAPFPQHWFSAGSGSATTLMRRTSALEMLVTYGALLSLLFGTWVWRRNIRLYLALGFSLGMILTYALVVANVGTLHRMRYGYIMILVSLGIAGFQSLLEKRAEFSQKRI